MDVPTATKKPRWGQARRLRFIDLRLQYDGHINRGDLIDFFDISTPQASADLGLYQSLAPQNMSYDPRGRTYTAQSEFRPLYGRTAATSYLDELQRLARNELDSEESFVGFVPPTGIVATPARAIEAAEVATLVQAIRDGAALRVRYQSMDHPEPLSLVLSPHALGFDGLRWHMRAWCHLRSMFRDFAVGRLEVKERVSDALRVDPASDAGWTNMVPLILTPHPKLSESQRNVVMRDYGMSHGRLILSCRKAMLFYTLRHLNLETLLDDENPARQHVVVENRIDVKRWMDEDRKGNAPYSAT